MGITCGPVDEDDSLLRGFILSGDEQLGSLHPRAHEDTCRFRAPPDPQHFLLPLSPAAKSPLALVAYQHVDLLASVS